MAAMTLQKDAPIDRRIHVQLIRNEFARSPLFREAAVSEPVRTREGRLALDVSFDGGPTAFRVVAGSEGEAYASLYELALAMVDVDEKARRSDRS
jgi:hypothetical protein